MLKHVMQFVPNIREINTPTHTSLQFGTFWNFWNLLEQIASRDATFGTALWNIGIIRMRDTLTPFEPLTGAPFVLSCSVMPKKGPTPSQWREKLRAFANGDYTFEKGQIPGKGSQWAIEVGNALYLSLRAAREERLLMSQ